MLEAKVLEEVERILEKHRNDQVIAAQENQRASLTPGQVIEIGKKYSTDPQKSN